MGSTSLMCLVGYGPFDTHPIGYINILLSVTPMEFSTAVLYSIKERHHVDDYDYQMIMKISFRHFDFAGNIFFWGGEVCGGGGGDGTTVIVH